MDFIEKIYCKVEKFFKLRHFVFRIDEYNGTEESNSIYMDQVFEYELINQGTTIIEIDGGLKLYPDFSGICSCRQRFVVNANEKDESVHQFKFLPLDFQVVTIQSSPPPPPVTAKIAVDSIVSTPVVVAAIPGDVQFNKLIVISKTYSKARRKDPM